ncbi:putative sporulation protein YyaC [Paenibacillus sp. oral taxon 786 str. D14]|uniref:spore protease YyaC n=1 Tax=Paenibacillus sp. oral taxon 786 TaxID=652715 RepID=UPI0001AFD42E|nr:spore protease YyaC [Paenibacillus sp. oral taxon 786]EES71214.1 putative sporulation protein YyaC [Paenibacillus sp. oral taxon 786 str. D14]
MQEQKEWPAAGVNRRKLNGGELAAFFADIRARHLREDVTFLCIGTDRSTGDALGPLVGTKLTELGFEHVIGTLREPCDATNLERRMAEIPEGRVIIAIDACLGMADSVGTYLVSSQPLQPAQSVGASLPEVGHYSIAAVVNVNGPKPYWTLQMTSLYKVMQMADEIAGAAASAFR